MHEDSAEITRSSGASPKAVALSHLSREDLIGWCAARGEPSFRADQIRRWLFQKRSERFEAMHDLPAPLRLELANEFELFSAEIVARRRASDGTEKLLLEWHDGSRVESVVMREPKRNTLCLSTQVGCGMGCVFCASGLLGLKRNLTSGEIVEQVLRLDRLLSPDERITNVVVMGIGEPLANLPALLPALDALTDARGLGLSPRRITISTVGLPEKIRELASTATPFNLAVSLHAPNDRLRNELVPVNGKIGLADILAAADAYFQKTGRRVTYEYVLLGGVNDSQMHARELAELLCHRNAHVNLIPMNRVSEMPYEPPTPGRSRRFVELLEAAGVRTTLRKRKGADIDAACGQLRLSRRAAQSSAR